MNTHISQQKIYKKKGFQEKYNKKFQINIQKSNMIATNKDLKIETSVKNTIGCKSILKTQP